MISNRYQILKEIGSGGIGRVFKAIDLFERETIAIKVLLNQKSEHVERFKKEFLLLRQLHHPNIVKVYDFGYSDSGEPYFTMEHVEGKDCKAFFEQLDYSKLWDIMLQICNTLDFLFSKRIVHGDIKPSNILISTSRDGQLRVKFTDFGFATHEKVDESYHWTGTLPYLAPEIIRGERYSPQVDLYSLGALIYEILYGKPPFDEENPMDLAKSHLERDPVIPEEPPVPTGLRNLLLKLLEKDPIDRFFSPEDVMDEIQNISGISLDNSEILLAKSLINSTDFAGREKEFNVLREALTNLSHAKNKSVLITGEAGIGKARLMEEFATWAQVGGFPVVSISLKENKILEAPQDDPFQFLETDPRPCVLIFQHLESAHDSFFKFLSDFTSRKQDKKFFICLTLTSDLLYPQRNQVAHEIEESIRTICGSSITSIKLNRLTETETEKMLDSMLGWRQKAGEITKAIYQETQGSPSLIGQLIESLVEEGSIRRENDKWLIEQGSIEKSKIPQGLKDEVGRRLTCLQPSSQELLACAAVWGLESELDVLIQLGGFDNTIISPCLYDILSHRFVEEVSTPDKREFRFANNLVRRCIYDQVDPIKRKALHRKAGEILEGIVLHKETDVYELANHFHQAGDVERGMRYSLLAAKQAEMKCEHDQAIAQYTRALGLYAQDPTFSSQSKEDILERLAHQFDLIGEPDKSLSTYEEVLRICSLKTSNPERPGIIYRKMGQIYEKMSEHEKAGEFLEKSLQIFKATKSPKHYAGTIVNLGWVYLRKSNYRKARTLFEEALSILQKEVTSNEKAFALSGLGTIHWSLGDYSQASSNHQESLKIFKEMGNTKKIADCYGNLGLIARSQGRLKEAIEYFRKCLDLLETLQDHYRLSILYNNLGLTYLTLNHWDQASECLHRACELKEKILDAIGLGFSYNNMGLVYLRKGELYRASEHFKTAITHFQSSRHKSGLALVYYNLADLYTSREEFDQALPYVKGSLKIRSDLGEEAGTADCFFLLGKIYLQQTAFDQATQNLLEAQNFYQKQGNREAEVGVLLCLAELSVWTRELAQAETYLAEAQDFLQRSESKFLRAHLNRVRASLMRIIGDYHNCLECLFDSAKVFRELEVKLELGRTYLEIGKTKLELARHKEAKGFLSEALNIFERTKIHSKKKEVESLLEQMKDLGILEKERIETFYRLAELLNNIWDTDELLTKSLELAIELLNAERGAIIFYSDKDKSFEVKVSQGIEQETSHDAVAISRQVLRDVVRSDSPLIVEDTRKDSRFAKSQSVVMYNILSILCVPLKTKNRLIGTVYLDHRGLPAIFSSEDVDFLRAFANLVATAIEKSELYVQANEEIFQLKEVLHRTYEYPGIIGRSQKMQEVFNMVEKVADSKTGVLILGENGTGKEVIANLIHTRSKRRDGPFIKVNCAALPETLLESELFGIEERTATGVGFRKGKFELADSGTIFLDEIGDMNLSVQSKVLRAIEEKEFERVGGRQSIKVDVRVISATNMDLHKKIEEGLFRKDLYFRLNPIVIVIPPLRERIEDIPFLIDYFLRRSSEENNKPPIRLSKRIVDALKDYSWPGNVRELEHLIESAIVLSEDGTFPEKLLPKEVMKIKSMINLDKYGKLKEVLEWVEKKKILLVLEKNKWNQTQAAKELGISEPTLRRRIKRHNISRSIRIRSS